MSWKFLADSPVYIQIADRIRSSVLSGEYAPGGQIPTVRQLATIAAVNPNTVQHAFSELEDQGLIVSKGTMGRFVTDDEAVIQSCRKKHAEKLVKQFLVNANRMSISKEELISMIKEADI
ncbi:MAG: GntR family transcriptional regulator [Ruminococcaceae bacterium]|nr:GntR family transcriptional regulator [Oscillospiraceae bacterium]